MSTLGDGLLVSELDGDDAATKLLSLKISKDMVGRH
jgi:hypothetical protein